MIVNTGYDSGTENAVPALKVGLVVDNQTNGWRDGWSTASPDYDSLKSHKLW